MAASDVRGLTEEEKALQEQKKYIGVKETRLRKHFTNNAALIERLQQVRLAIDELAVGTKEMNSGGDYALAKLSPSVKELVTEISGDYKRYGIDEVVADFSLAFKTTLYTWSPLREPHKMADILRAWRPALRISSKPEPDTEVDIMVFSGL